MAGASRQKQKLLVMERLFMERTDEAYAITGNELIRILGDMGIKAERKTIYDDIATLCDVGLDIQTTKSGHSNAYYLDNRLFSDEELKVLADCVAGSRFLTIKRSNEFIKKLQTLTSEQKAPMLRRSVHIDSRTKSPNETSYKAVSAAQEAIFSDRQIEFLLSEAGAERRKQGKLTLASPYFVVLEGDYYYIICLTADREVARLRADRMTEAAVSREKRVALSEDEELRMRKLKSPSGTEEQLRLCFDKEILGEVYDRFGDKITVRENLDGSFSADVTAQLSNVFWGWLFAFGEKIRVIAPEYVSEIAGEKIEKLRELYKQ